MRKIVRFFSVGLTALMMILMMTSPVLAANGATFRVSPVLPENQTAGVKGYFDLAVTPGQVQDLSVAIENNASEDMIVEVEAITASTNLNGVVNYTTPGENDDSLVQSIADLLHIQEPVLTIPANSSKILTVQVRMPKEPYEGYLLGSIHIKKRLSQAEVNSGQTILNQYSYVIAVKLTESDAVIDNEFVVDEVQAELINGRASIVNRIVNPRPVLVKGMNTTVTIFSKDSAMPVMERTMENTDMAPNSVFPFTLVDDAGYGVQAGAYLSLITIQHNGRTWTFEREFEIKAEQAAAINTSAVNLETNQTAMTQRLPGWAIAITIIVSVVIGLVIVLLIYLIKKTHSMSTADAK